MTVQSFVQQVHQSNEKEIELAQLAKTRARSQDVKDYADMLLKDHIEANKDLHTAASKAGVTIPAGAAAPSAPNPAGRTTPAPGAGQPQPGGAQTTPAPNRDDQAKTQTPQTPGRTTPGATATTSLQSAEYRELSAKSGAEFDKAYVNMMVENHQKSIALFERQQEAKLGNKDIQEFISDTLPTLRDHLKEGREVLTKLNKGEAEPAGSERNK
jgi:putative membrane protein